MLKSQKGITGWIAAAAVVLVVLFAVSKSAVVESVYPFERMKSVWSRHVAVRLRGAVRGAAAEAENRELRRMIGELKLANDENASLERENASLRQALGFVRRTPGRWLGASVLSRGGGAAARSETLRLDVGSGDGVRVGAAVVVPDGLVGLVTAATPHTAEVTLLTDPTVMVDCEVVVGSANPPRAVLVGGGRDNRLRLRYLRHFEGCAGRVPGAHVVTTGQGGVFPRGLTVGTVRSVDWDEQGLAREGVVDSAVAFDSIGEVFVRREK